jgi:L-2-hydroxyglutarate oxidase LhgO
MVSKYDVLIIGGGVIGTAIARQFGITLGAGVKVAIVEKEASFAYHTSGRNSGVVHSGINQTPGSLKAKFCVEGNRKLRQYAKAKGIPLEECGTVVLAKDKNEQHVIRELYRRGRTNGVPGLEILDARALSVIEPHANAVEALHSPTGSITDSRWLVRSFAGDAKALGVSVFLGTRVREFKAENGGLTVETNNGEIGCRLLVNAGGLYADKIARKLGHSRRYSIVPFRGQYFKLTKEKRVLVRGMIYPSPNLEFPFLGVHFTKRTDGSVILGPNAVLAGGREAYTPSDFSVRETLQALTFPGLIRAAFNPVFIRMAASEFHTAWDVTRFISLAKQLVPEVESGDLLMDTSGIRAQLMSTKGKLVDDFVIEWGEDSVHILNSVSPGMTCSLPFADYVVAQAVERGYVPSNAKR